MDGDFPERSKKLVELENENMKQTIYRLSLELRSQKEAYEDEIDHLKMNLIAQGSEFAELNKVKLELERKVLDYNTEIEVKNSEIEKLQTLINEKDNQSMKLLAVPHRLPYSRKNPIPLRSQKAETLPQHHQKLPLNDQEFSWSTTVHLKSLTQKLLVTINKQNAHLEQNNKIMDSFKNVIAELQNNPQTQTQTNNTNNNNNNEGYLHDYNSNSGPGETAITRSRSQSQVETDNKVGVEISELKSRIDVITLENHDLKSKMKQLDDNFIILCEEVNSLRKNQNDLIEMWSL